jgi:hypothetical protein
MRRHWLVTLYPPRWRARYGDELEALLDEQPVTPALVIDIVRGAFAARAASPATGGITMRTRVPALASLLAVLLVLPAVTFLTAAMVRSMQPVQYQPAHAAQAVFDAFATLPASAVWLLLGLAPLFALGLALLAAWRRLRDDPAVRDDVAAFVEGWRRILHQPALVLAGLALIASLGVLAFAVTHAIAG